MILAVAQHDSWPEAVEVVAVFAFAAVFVWLMFRG